ncbi:MAG TPA: ATPase [Candidatus Pullilachnospira intestinigallinarum]|nr:ATPase [Candidatus Pullilachnospira intestinigallinarum]
MEQIIEKLSEIETAASRIMESAAEEKKLMDQQQQERIAACDAQIEAATQKKLEELRASLKKQSESELEQLRINMEETLRRMDDVYKRDHDRITDEIYHKIIRK